MQYTNLEMERNSVLFTGLQYLKNILGANHFYKHQVRLSPTQSVQQVCITFICGCYSCLGLQWRYLVTTLEPFGIPTVGL
jgi:hypothetical protein